MIGLKKDQYTLEKFEINKIGKFLVCLNNIKCPSNDYIDRQLIFTDHIIIYQNDNNLVLNFINLVSNL